ncbi:MAG TPA: tRNA (N6-isopentenyl adenosine(37)-C2)-methylthiotransferase MiaB [Vicinamibacterales bacterium]|nr:tRNA (N6-isopentenyl adenosine(37)-C2)-methylthiotransferase MiaB [Vicinamibacterales bacterium]
MAGRYLIETFGCQMNVHDSERMAGLLERAGYAPAADPADADVIVLNTCSVREHAERKLYARLGELRIAAARTGRRPIVAVAGCVAQQEGERLAHRAPGIDIVLGTQSLKQLPDLVARAHEQIARRPRRVIPLVDVNPYEDVSFPLGVARRGDPVKAYVTIIEGCNDYCAFCVVPYTRGHERMRPAAEILAEVAEAAASGRREIHLLGQIVNHYQAPDLPGCDFAGLLERVHAVPGVDRIRFASPHPRHVTSRLIEAIRDLPAVCKHLHLPVQSGSTRILRAMRRRYTRDSYLALVDRVRAAIPDITLSTDIIVGFPGETPADFEETLSLLERVRFHSVFSFKYSERPHTLAAKRLPDDVPEAEKGRRLAELQARQREIQEALHRAAVGRRFEVLLEAPSRRGAGEVAGRTTGNVVVNVPGDPGWIGRMVDVRITDAGPNSLRGHIIGGEVAVAPPAAGLA